MHPVTGPRPAIISAACLNPGSTTEPQSVVEYNPGVAIG